MLPFATYYNHRHKIYAVRRRWWLMLTFVGGGNYNIVTVTDEMDADFHEHKYSICFPEALPDLQIQKSRSVA